MQNISFQRPLRAVASLLLLLAAIGSTAHAGPKLAVTIKQPELPALGNFWLYEMTHRMGKGDDQEVLRMVMTMEVDRIEKDEKSGLTRYRYRNFQRMRGDGVEHIFDLFENLSTSFRRSNWSYIDPKLKSWIGELDMPEFDKESGKPTGKTTLISRILFPAPITGQGQILKHNDVQLKVVSLNRTVTTPAGTFRCIAIEQEGGAPGDPSGKKFVTVIYNHRSAGVVKSEYYTLDGAKRTLTGMTLLRSAELHTKDGIKSHRDYAEPEKADAKKNTKEIPKAGKNSGGISE